MIVVGDLSGIQTYLFDVADAGGGQARRMRARSFFLQLLPEAAALRVLAALDWWPIQEHLLSSCAGKLLMRGVGPGGADARLRAVDKEINEWLLSEARGELRFALAWADGDCSEVALYGKAMCELQQRKARAWAALATANSQWLPQKLILSPLGIPCDLCRHATAEIDEWDDETGDVRRVCRRCAADRELGKQLPRARTLVFREALGAGIEVLGYSVQCLGGEHAPDDRTIAMANLVTPDERPSGCPPDRFLRRRLMCHVPLDDKGRPVWFQHLAEHARGDQLLGVFKADADSLGAVLENLLNGASNLGPVVSLGRQLDDFFAGRLKDELEGGSHSDWRSIYTVYAGGDDLVLVGPWNVMLDFAGRLQDLFQQGFGRYGLTISAGLAFAKWRRPIKHAVAEADRLLEIAKLEPVRGAAAAKDQIAAFGQVWKWHAHAQIIQAGKQVADWVERDEMQRGWLHTLLGLAEARLGDPENGRPPDPLATARLAHHVARNYRSNSKPRRWAERLIELFDDPSNSEVHYLPTIVRYALTATRMPGKEE